MSPDELQDLLTSLEVAANVLEAIDDPDLQTLWGWDLTSWSYATVPWGVRFTHWNHQNEIDAEVEVGRAPQYPKGETHNQVPWQKIVVVLR
jgi:hypothetical protein